MKRKAIIFPYNAECASLVRNRELLLNHEIVACVSPIGYGLQGKDAAYAYGGENTGIVISDKKISEINFDDLLVCESSSDFDTFIMPQVKLAAECGKNVIFLYNISQQQKKEAEETCKKKNVKCVVLTNRRKQMNMLGQWNTIIDSIMVQFLSTLLYILGANLVFDMKLSVGSVFAFITYSAYVTGPISAILNIGYLLSGIIPSTKRYYAFMELEEETDNGKKTDLCPNDLRLQKVSFAYERDKCILKNIDILFAKSSKTAIIGRNGSGKTTIINLLTRMYEPTSGEILLGAENISELPLPEYRNMVSVVSQQIYLFNDTIRNNICLYKQIDDTVIEAACKDSGLEDFIKEVSLDHVVGQNGAMLSGGQKQKIALARALVHDKPIIIFDEATSNTDAYSEQQINGLLDTRLKDKTVIVITHKKEVLSKVDQIVVLKEGVVADLGRYDDLVGKSDELNVMLEKAE